MLPLNDSSGFSSRTRGHRSATGCRKIPISAVIDALTVYAITNVQ
jgi:hypothetical protein